MRREESGSRRIAEWDTPDVLETPSLAYLDSSFAEVNCLQLKIQNLYLDLSWLRKNISHRREVKRMKRRSVTA